MGKHAPMPAYMKGTYDNKALLLIKMTRAQLAEHIDKWRKKYKDIEKTKDESERFTARRLD